MKRSTSRLKLLTTAAAVIKEASRPGSPALTVRVQAVPRLVRATLSGAYAGTSRSRLALVVGAVAYVASPVDLVPEAVLPVLGVADDVFVIGWAVKTFMEETERFLSWERGQGVVPPGTVRGHVVPPAGRPVDPTQDRTGAASWAARAGSASAARSSSSAQGGRAAAFPPGPAGRSGASAPGSTAAPLRGAATDYVLEAVRKRLER